MKKYILLTVCLFSFFGCKSETISNSESTVATTPKLTEILKNTTQATSTNMELNTTDSGSPEKIEIVYMGEKKEVWFTYPISTEIRLMDEDKSNADINEQEIIKGLNIYNIEEKLTQSFNLCNERDKVDLPQNSAYIIFKIKDKIIGDDFLKITIYENDEYNIYFYLNEDKETFSAIDVTGAGDGSGIYVYNIWRFLECVVRIVDDSLTEYELTKYFTENIRSILPGDDREEAYGEVIINNYSYKNYTARELGGRILKITPVKTDRR